MNRIREARRELKMSQGRLSAALRETDARVDVAMVSRFETGLCLPTPALLAGLEAALQKSRMELFEAADLQLLDPAVLFRQYQNKEVCKNDDRIDGPAGIDV